MFLSLSILYTNKLVAVKFSKTMAYREYPPRGRQPSYQMVTLNCQRCSTSFSVTLTYAQARNPQRWRPYCHTCFQEMQRRECEAKRIAKEQRDAALLAERISLENHARIKREAAEAEAKREEDVKIAELRIAFDANPDEFIRKFVRLSTKVDEQETQIDDLSERIDRIEHIEHMFENLKKSFSSISHD